MPPTKLDDQGTAAPKLSLYTMGACGFCSDVECTIDKLGMPVELHDISGAPERRNELVSACGRATVPVLRIESAEGEVRWMRESRDIIRYLRGLAGQPDPMPRWFDEVRRCAQYVPWLLLLAGVVTHGVTRAVLLVVGCVWIAARQIHRARRSCR
jgi:glutaredoxin